MAKRDGNKVRKAAKLGHFSYDPILHQLGQTIGSLRKEKGFPSSDGFAYDIDISRVRMQRYEKSEFNDIRLRTLLKIIDGLELTMEEFFERFFNDFKVSAKAKKPAPDASRGKNLKK